ncbi:MAG TPA: response regulator transcription factor [Solirubrobacteraceae bacterium]|nr:response regulator transcription factor [Solirubrobacteraceae bacterium]
MDQSSGRRTAVSLPIGSALLAVLKTGEKAASTEADSRVLPPLPQTEQLAVVGDPARVMTIGKILRRNGWSLEPFESIDGLIGLPEGSRFALIVLWVDDTASGLAAHIEAVRRSVPGPSLVLACPSIERWGVRSALAAGVAGIVTSQDLESVLGPCVEAVLTGQTCVPREYGRQIDPPALSAREKQILGLVVMGYMNSQIARQLFLAESTVKSHLSSAFSKLGVRSRSEAVSLILDPERGLGIGILGLGGDPVEPLRASAR